MNSSQERPAPAGEPGVAALAEARVPVAPGRWMRLGDLAQLEAHARDYLAAQRPPGTLKEKCEGSNPWAWASRVLAKVSRIAS